jgi:hypothetical protein
MLKQQFFSANGTPLVGGFLYSYAAGTSTPLATYTDQSGATPNTNPIVLDANGQCTMWLGASAYKFVLQDASNNVLQTWDNVSYINPGSITSSMIGSGQVQAGNIAAGAVGTTQIANLAVGSAQIAVGGVATTNIAAQAVTTAKIANAAVTGTQIAATTITGANIAAATIADSNLVSVARVASLPVISYTLLANTVAGVSITPIPGLLTTITTSGRNVRVGIEAGILQNENFANAAWKIWSYTTTATDQTTAVQAGTATTILPTTVSQGCIIQSPNPFGTVTFTVSQASASGVYTYQYWNGSAWTTLTTTSTPSFTATGSTSLTFSPPAGWLAGAGSSGANESYFSVRIVSSTAPATAVQITALTITYNANSSGVAYGDISHGMTGNSTTAGAQNASVQTYLYLERSSSPVFATYPVIVAAVTRFYSTQVYNGQTSFVSLGVRDLFAIDDDGGAGLAAGTYYYRVRVDCVRTGACSSAAFQIFNLKLRAEEVR